MATRSRMRRAGTSAEDLKAAARMIRAEEEASVLGRAPAIEYADIENERAEIVSQGEQTLAEAEATSEKIRADEDELIRRTLPEEDRDLDEEPTSLIERLPEHIEEPPKIEEELHLRERLEPAVAAVRRGLDIAKSEFVKTVKAGMAYEKEHDKWEASMDKAEAKRKGNTRQVITNVTRSRMRRIIRGGGTPVNQKSWIGVQDTSKAYLNQIIKMGGWKNLKVEEFKRPAWWYGSRWKGMYEIVRR